MKIQKGTIKMKRENIIRSIIFILMLVPLASINAQVQEISPFIFESQKPVKLLRTFGKGQFGSINNICISPKKIIYVSDAGDRTVKAFNMRGEFLFSFGQESGSELHSIMELGLDKDGNVYVADYDQDLVNVYNSNGKYLFNIKLDAKLQNKRNDRGASGVAVNSRGDIYITDSANGRIEVRDNNREYKFQIDKFKDKYGKLDLVSPTHPRINSRDELYVIDPMICRVHHFSAEGNYLDSFGYMGNDSPGGFLAPSGLAIDKYDRVFVIDLKVNAVQVFDREGKFLYVLSNEKGDRLETTLPTGLAADNENLIYIGCNDGGWVVRVFKYTAGWE